ncbi:uncharacterized protein LOC132747322 [Ruditapes philippinarum]|uniref:uncharacterized protein LOC132747322 n=1 Tax=Ruditapes philippinarum TaxID=129788 RepID=UPI00295B21A9|nr:uncharacterized protein LOC132747322 [Ruditapes philippinarum]
MVQKLGKCAFMAKADISSAFNLCPIWPGDFDLLGIKSDEGYWIQKTLPMGASCSCFIFEKFSTFIEWLAKKEAKSDYYDHLLDDFIIMHNSFDNCQFLMLNFLEVCARLNVPLSKDKWEGPVKIITYLGLEIDACEQMIRVPQEKIDKAKLASLSLIESKKVTLQQLQALTGLLNFLAKALPSGRAFIRRFYDRMSKVKKSFHFVRVSKDMRDDAYTWLQFLEEFNGTRIFNESEWFENGVLELYTDAAGNKNMGCGCYFNGSWSVFKWPQTWEENIFKDITYLELIPILLALHIWGRLLERKKIILRTDNAALVDILNKKSSRNKNVMVLIRSLKRNIQVKAKHVHGKRNKICDSISRFQWQRLHRLLPDSASRTPCLIPDSFLQTLRLNVK